MGQKGAQLAIVGRAWPLWTDCRQAGVAPSLGAMEVWGTVICCHMGSGHGLSVAIVGLSNGGKILFFQLIITERLQTNFQKSFLLEAVGPRTLPCCFRGWPLPEVGAWEREGASCCTRPAVQNRGLGQSARLWSCISSSVKWDKNCSSSDPPKQGHVFV